MNEDTARIEFLTMTGESVKALERRMGTYLQSLNGTAAFLSASENPTSDEFESYMNSLNIAEFLPGINGIGLIEPIAAGDEATLIRKMEDIGEAEFRLHPQTDNDERFIITRISPRLPNKEALGLDITFELGRRTAALQSRATGDPRLTPRILLVQHDKKEPGFLLLLPVSKSEVSLVEASSFFGWIYAPFVGRNLLNDLTENQGRNYHFNVYDGQSADEDALIFSSSPAQDQQSNHQAQYTVDMYGRNWTVVFRSLPAFDDGFGSLVPAIVVIVGALLSGLLLFSIHNLRARGEAMGEVAALRAREVSARAEENRSIIENDVTAVFILDGAERILFANQAAVHCFGYRPTELPGMCFTDLITRAEHQAGQTPFNARGTTLSGEPLMLDLQRNNWLTSEGEPRVTAIVRDLTVEYETQRELENTKTLYDLALKGSQIGVFDLDLKTGLSEVSDTWCELMGIARSDNDLDTQKMFMSRVHPDDLPKLQEADAECIKGNTSRSIFEYRMRFGADEWRWMRSDAVVVERDINGLALRLIGTQTDVTGIYHSRNALEASEKRFRQVLSSAPIGMALMRQDGSFIEVNSAFSRLAGEGEQALLSKGRLSDLMSAEDFEAFEEGIAALVNDETVDVYKGEHRLLQHSGGHRWGLFNVSWTYDKNTDSNFFIAQINDITDQKRLDQIKNEFVSTVSHELRTPLTSIKGALGLIHASENQNLKDSSKRLIDIARSNTDRLTTIVNDILDLEKISSGEVSFDFESVDILELIEAGAHEMSPFATTHNVTIRTDLPGTPVYVQADQSRTKQVLANLISNACKYSDDNSEILIKAEQLEDKAIVYVQNTGRGIPNDFKPQMFKAFSQADGSDTRAKGGTGLGLNITKQIVKRHKGEIGFESIPNSITVFWFTYPLAEAKPKPAPVMPLNRNLDKKDSKFKVLHLEDDEDFAEVIASSLSHVADVTHVTSVAQARVKLATMDVDVIILDWILPDGNAAELLDEIFEALPNARVLGLSADGDQRQDPRLAGNLVKSRTDLSRIVDHVTGLIARAS